MSVQLRDRVLELPLLQGGMGVGVSMGGLAGAVAACGAMGTISTAIAGYAEPDFESDPNGANLRALAKEVQKAKQIAAGKGLVAINAMVATTQYAESVCAAVQAGVDAIVSGAGLPLELPAIVKNPAVLLAPVVSGARAARTICKVWQKRYHVLPDFLVLEGCEAGGHLGFSREEAEHGTAAPLATLVREVVQAVAPYEAEAGRKIPVFAAGGVWDGRDAAALCREGAAGVQLATRFIATYECDAAQGFKDVLLRARQEDVQIIHSPVGMPGRALRTPLIQKLAEGAVFPPKRCVNCLTPCAKAQTPYCIAHALIQAVQGNEEEGLFFCGSNVWRLDGMHHVAELIDQFMAEWRAFA